MPTFYCSSVDVFLRTRDGVIDIESINLTMTPFKRAIKGRGHKIPSYRSVSLLTLVTHFDDFLREPQ